jgi:hypothetical protein
VAATAEGGGVAQYDESSVSTHGHAFPALVRVWEIASGKQRLQIDLADMAHPERDDHSLPAVAALAFSPDARLLAIGVDSTAYLWDLRFNREVRRFSAGAGRAVFAFSPTERILVLGGAGGRRPFPDSTGYLRLYDIDSGEELARVDHLGGVVTAMSFSADGKLLLTGSSDSTALLWDVGRLTADARRRHQGPSPADLAALWDDLASADAARADRAVWTLAMAPAQAIPYLEARLRPAPAVDGARLARLVAELSHESFTARQRAATELERPC